MTGYNAAFLIDGATRDRLIAKDPRSAEILKPILRGRDIGRYRAEWAGLWLIASHNGHGDIPAVDVSQYAAVKSHLDQFYDRLAARHDQGKTPYNLRNCAYHAEFSKRKLLWMDMSTHGRFAVSDTTVFCNDKGFLLTGASLRYLSAILNSRLVSWLMRSIGITTGMGQLQWKKFAVENIPVPRPAPAEEDPLIHVVDAILSAKDADGAADTVAFEAELDRMVYELYELTERDIAAIT